MWKLAIALLCMIATPVAANPLPKKVSAPPTGKILVAFVMSEGATMIDFAGPWEVFQDVYVEGRGKSPDDASPFQLYTVSDTTAPFRATGGMQIVPDYTFANAPAPRIVVIGAQGGKSPQMMEWLRKMSKQADVVMSVCTGSFKLGAAGLLDGKPATTHHDFYDIFARTYPKAKLLRSKRYVQSDPVVVTAGGLTSGIDLALHIVGRYFGQAAAQRTAEYMEYEGTGWKR